MTKTVVLAEEFMGLKLLGPIPTRAKLTNHKLLKSVVGFEIFSPKALLMRDVELSALGSHTLLVGELLRPIVSLHFIDEDTELLLLLYGFSELFEGADFADIAFAHQG